MKKLLLVFLLMFSSPIFASGINANSASAPCTNNTLETYSGNSNLQADWQPNTINLRWYNEDQKLTVQSSAQSCTYEGTLTVPSTQPTRTGYTFAGWEVKYTVPAGYTELEYIEGGTSLNAYIDLGFSATPTMQTLLKASIIDLGEYEAETVIFGSSDNSGYANGKPYSIDRLPDSVLIPNGFIEASISKVLVTVSLNTIYEYKINYPTVGTIGVNDITKTSFTNITSVASNNLWVFWYHGASAGNNRYVSVGRMKLYNLKLWDNGELIHNYIPAKNPNNVIGIYDTVTGAFLTNSGTGTFIAGPVVQ